MGQYPQQKIIITHDGSDTEIQGTSVSVLITRRENKGSDAVLTATDYIGQNFLNQIENDDIIQVFFKDETMDWVQQFAGYVVEMTPSLKIAQGELLGYKAYGLDVCLDRMRVKDEYGTESKHKQIEEDFDRDLAINDWIPELNEWTHVDAPDDPWIDIDDDDAGYISCACGDAYLNDYDSYWTFENLSGLSSADITKAEIYLKARLYGRTQPCSIRVLVWNGTDWNTPPSGVAVNNTSYTELMAFDVTAILNTLSKINSARIQIQLIAATDETEAINTDLAVATWTNDNWDWGHVPAGPTGPWLDSDDDDTTYINIPVDSAHLNDYDEAYTFTNLSGLYKSATISKAEVYVKAKISGRTNNVGICVYVWDGSSWTSSSIIYFDSTSYTEKLCIDCTSILNTLAKVNGAKIKIEFATYGGGEQAGYLMITYARLHIEGTGTFATKGEVRVTYARLHVEGTGYIGVPQTFKNILTNADWGIIPKYVKKILATAIDSGYDLDTTYLLDDLTVIKYLYCPYTPANDCIRGLLDLIAAAKYPSAGLHWLVVPNGKATPWLCIDQIGNHTTASTKWPTAAPISLETGVNIEEEQFEFRKQEGNYIVQVGKYEWPTTELATEIAAKYWDEYNGISWTITDDADCKAGSYSVKFHRGATQTWIWYYFYYPAPSQNLTLNIEKIGTKRQPPSIGFYVKQSNIGDCILIMGTKTNGAAVTDYYYKNIQSRLPSAGIWGYIDVPCGPYFSKDEKEWTKVNNADWTNINYIGFAVKEAALAACDVFIDDLVVKGTVCRAAYDSASIAAHKCQIKLVTDSLAKSANLDPDDDSGTVAQLAKAELLRSMTTPIQGTVTLKDLVPNILPGQIIHVHARRKTSGFHINKDFRILEVQQDFKKQRPATKLTITDDVLNSYPMEPTNAYNFILKASNPDYQDRDRGNLKGREIDIEQEILAYDYAP